MKKPLKLQLAAAFLLAVFIFTCGYLVRAGRETRTENPAITAIDLAKEFYKVIKRE